MRKLVFVSGLDRGDVSIATLSKSILSHLSIRAKNVQPAKLHTTLLFVALLLLGIGRSFGQSVSCGHREPVTDYPDGSFMNSSGADPCGSGSGSGLGILGSQRRVIPTKLTSRLIRNVHSIDLPASINKSNLEPVALLLPQSEPTRPVIITSSEPVGKRGEA